MKNCASCGAECREAAVFCAQCGTRLAPSKCRACDRDLVPEARFCDGCGTPVAGEPSAPKTTSSPAERRQVTVLFADAKGSTELTEQIGDEEAYRLVQGCVAAMSDAVERHEGHVAQFRGDGIMALFGAPVALEDAAVRAVRAALEMQAALNEKAHELSERVGAQCHFRVGVHSGPVVVGRLGDNTVVDYTAIGDTANVAARLEQAADPGSVFISDSTWRAVRDFVECDRVGELDVKGKSAPVQAFRAVRSGPARTRLDAALARGLTRFVGREQELDVLQGFVSRLRAGRGQVVLVSGDAGIGKSRLLLELRAALPDDVTWVEGYCSAVGRNTPWLPIVDLLRRALDVDDSDDAAAVAAKIEDRAKGWSEEAQAAVPYVKWLLHAGGEELDDLDPRERRAGAYEALRTVMLDAATRRPVVLAIEDLHWADDASEGAIAAMAQAVASAPVLLILTYRPGYSHSLGDHSWYTRLALDQLPPEDASSLAAALLEVGDLPDEVRTVIAKRAEGNPLFVEEIAASLVETGALRRTADGYELAVRSSDLDIPATLQDVILARIDRLDREARSALQLAAVIGREFTRRLLDRIAEMPDGVDQHLGELQRLELIRQKSYFPELAFLFKHALTHDVAYSTLLGERRRLLHRIVAEAIEELYGERLVEHYDALARHWLEAGDDNRALHYLQLAADKAYEGYAVREALAYYDEIVEVAARLGAVATVLDTRLQGARVLSSMGEFDAAAPLLEEAEAAARALGDLDGQAMATAYRAYGELFLHEFDRADVIADEALRIPVGSTGDGRLFALAVKGTLVIVLNRQSEYGALRDEAVQLFSTASPSGVLIWREIEEIVANWKGRWDDTGKLVHEDLTQLPDISDRATVMWGAALGAAGKGDYNSSLRLLHDMIGMCERAGEVLFHSRALNTVGWIYTDLHDHDRGVEWNTACLKFVAPLNFPNAEVESNARLNLADSLLCEGRLDEAEAELSIVEQTVRHPRPADAWMLWRYSQHFFHTAGEVRLARGDAPAALALADECLELAIETESPKNEVKGRRLRGQALAELGRSEDATRELDEAVELARKLGNPPQLWRALHALAQVKGERGDRSAARAVAAEAAALIERTAAALDDKKLREALLGSREAAAIRAMR